MFALFFCTHCVMNISITYTEKMHQIIVLCRQYNRLLAAVRRDGACSRLTALGLLLFGCIIAAYKKIAFFFIAASYIYLHN